MLTASYLFTCKSKFVKKTDFALLLQLVVGNDDCFTI
ncbi:MAG: hypothetical protein RLZZ419_557 [Pseudomonadota bacterium]|jgi:hypothetical protein